MSKRHRRVSLNAQITAAEICSILLSEGADLHPKDDKNRTTQHYAARYSTPEMVERLVQAGVDVNSVDKNEHNACHRLVERGTLNDERIR